MFTGITRELAVVQRLGKSGDTYRLDIRSNGICKDVEIGDSIAVNGVCLTVASKEKDILNFDVMAQTLRKTTLAGLKDKDTVNLEGSLKAGGTLDGHFVLGHVDCVGIIRDIRKSPGEFMMRIDFPEEFGRLIVDKGSIAVDGVSLTIGRAGKDTFDIYLIPHTLRSTTLSTKRSGDAVNLEFDILGKYAAKHRDAGSQSRISEEFLRSRGF